MLTRIPWKLPAVYRENVKDADLFYRKAVPRILNIFEESNLKAVFFMGGKCFNSQMTVA